MAADGRRKKSGAVPRPTSVFSTAAKAANLATQPGKAALDARYRSGVVLKAGFSHTESIDLDAAFQATEPNENRWDYAVGIRAAAGEEMAFWIEPHPASSTSDVDAMLAKLRWLRLKLGRPENRQLRMLRDAAQPHGSPYRWLVSQDSRIHITPMSREARLIAREGLSAPRHRVQLP